MASQGKKSLSGARNSERKNGKAAKKNPQSNPDPEKAKGRGGYSFKGASPKKAEAWTPAKARAKSKARSASRRAERLAAQKAKAAKK